MKIFLLVFMHVLPEKTQCTFITFIIKILNTELNRSFFNDCVFSKYIA